MPHGPHPSGGCGAPTRSRRFGGEIRSSAPTSAMNDRPTPMDPELAERRFAEMLEQAGLPRFTSAFHDSASDALEVSWDHGLTLYLDLTRPDMSPIDDWERAAILG